MKVVRNRDEIPYEKNTILTLGSFDGVHRAHRELLAEVVRMAREQNGRSLVVTFDPHPKEVLTGMPASLLTTLEEKEAICRDLGIDLFYVIPFTYEFSRQSSREFFVSYFIERIGVSVVVEGYDHHFGRDREGSIEELLRLGKEFEFSVVAMKPVYVGEEIVSSSKIRQHLVAGEVEKATRLLGRPYSLSGVVVQGDGRGRTLGYPTANIRPSSDRKLIPANGIYFVQVKLDGAAYFGMLSIGVRPTFTSRGQRTVEVNILDFQEDIYGKPIEVVFLKRLRDELKFESAEELIEQMDRDKEESLKLIPFFARATSISQ
jgi:riboflavin kinase/FMN adenylyltransferase